MATPSLTYTLTNGTAADATQVMQNFNDLISGITDGTRDITIGTLTSNGLVTVANQVALTGADIAKTSAPTIKRIYPNSLVKAWGVLTTGAAGAVTVTEAYNMNTATYSGNILTINFHSVLSSANYAVSVQGEAVDSVTNVFTGGYVLTAGKAVGSVQIVATKRDGSAVTIVAGNVFHIIIFGT